MSSSIFTDENMQVMMDQRKRKRMQSNRESAKRSRLRKQQHVDDLTAEVARLSRENHQIMTRVNVTKQSFITVEADNSVLRAQAMELTRRLKSLNEILNYINSATSSGSCFFRADDFHHQGFSDGISTNPWPTVDVFDYC